MRIETILEHSLFLRREKKFRQAYEYVSGLIAPDSAYAALPWQHNPIFWSDISAGSCVLTRRNADDHAFVRELFELPGFRRSFHRNANQLPKENALLQSTLDEEMISILFESGALHWVVRDAHRQPWGLLSLCDVSLTHQRAEILIGMRPNSPIGLTVSAMLMLHEFYFKFMKFNKLVSFVYKDNPKSFKSTLHLGFVVEGELHQHNLDPETGQFIDVMQLGLNKGQAFSQSNQRLAQRLLRQKTA
jgi:RimJ/RimL family protein N-acetyltransferase